MVKKIYFAWVLLVALVMSGCESLEDTYSDYSGELIRYVGKCTDVKVTPGWERLHVEWKNNLDPAIENIKISCKADGIVRDTLLEAGTASCDIKNMEDGSYEVSVYAVDMDGNLSLGEPGYGRPYTYQHEEVRSFSPGVTKYFFVGNNIVLFMDAWTDNIVDFKLNYRDMDGNARELPLTQEVFTGKYYLLENVDVREDVFITREGRVQDCPDLIVFEPYELTSDPIFSSDFMGWVKEYYGLDEIGSDFINNTTTLEFDYDVLSFEDVLYFPALEKIVLGSHRYLFDDEASITKYGDSWNSSVNELEKSVFILKVAQKLRDLKIERYFQHYFPKGTALNITEMGIPSLPDLNYLDTEGWTIENSEPANDLALYPVKNLLDNHSDTYWTTLTHQVLYTYDLTIDMQVEQSVNGIKIVQSSRAEVLNFLPGIVQIETSTDGYTWEMFTGMQNNTLGDGLGESTLYRLSAPKQARYIKVTVSDKMYGAMNVSLGDIAVF